MTIENSKWAPDFIGIGTMKAASYWIYRCLEAHPEICVSSRKELHYFDMNYKNGEKWYRSFFRHCEQRKICGEYTPAYMAYPNAPFLIQRNYPDVKLFACLRNPVERAYSHYRFGVSRKGKMSIYKNFEDALENDESLVKIGLYYQQLKVYFDLFPDENIFIFLYDDIRKDPAQSLQKLYSFLGVDATFVPSMTNTKEGVTGTRIAELRIPYLNTILYRAGNYFHGSSLDRILSSLGIKSWISRLAQANRKFVDAKPSQQIDLPPLSQDTYNKLSMLFRDDVNNLETLINHDLSAWRNEATISSNTH